MTLKERYFQLHPKRVGETDKHFETELYAEWLEQELEVEKGLKLEAYDEERRLRQENKELREMLRKCYPYLHELQAENFEDAGAGIFYDQSLEDVFNALCKAVGIEWIEEQALNKEK